MGWENETGRMDFKFFWGGEGDAPFMTAPFSLERKWGVPSEKKSPGPPETRLFALCASHARRKEQPTTSKVALCASRHVHLVVPALTRSYCRKEYGAPGMRGNHHSAPLPQCAPASRHRDVHGHRHLHLRAWLLADEPPEDRQAQHDGQRAAAHPDDSLLPRKGRWLAGWDDPTKIPIEDIIELWREQSSKGEYANSLYWGAARACWTRWPPPRTLERL
jgi:hypothetical protein